MALVGSCGVAASMIVRIRVTDLAVASRGRVIAALNRTVGVVGN